MDVRIEELENIVKHDKTRAKAEEILKDFHSHANEDIYMKAQALLEWINVQILTKHFKIELPDFDMIRIAEAYRKVDMDLFNEMVSVNGEYNAVDMQNVLDADVAILFCHIDTLVQFVLEKCPEIN